MKRLLLLCLPFLLTGCIRYGEGEFQGYITYVSDGWIMPRAGIKTALESSEMNCIAFADESLRDQLKQAAKDKTPVTIHYNKHMILPSACGGSEITSIEVQ